MSILLALILMMTVGAPVVSAGGPSKSTKRVAYVCIDPMTHYVDIRHGDISGRPDITIKTPHGKVVPPQH